MARPWFLLLSMLGCSVAMAAHGTADDGVLYFEKYIRPLLIEYCYECHSASSKEFKGGLRLDDRKAWQEGGNSGPAIVPGEPDASLVIKAVMSSDPDERMPPDDRLSNDAINHLKHWIAMGAPDPREFQAAQKTTSNPADPIAGREHWAFRPLNASHPPIVEGNQATHSAIDAFIRDGWKQAGLVPSKPADDRVIVRRLSYQLTGLPPSIEQMDSFASNSQPNRKEQLVDQLISSPRFGERFGRHWLDLARFADSNGLDENFLFREAWRYRNWVIDAINSDQPFDRFVLEQIAGDLLPYQDIEQRDRQRVGAGFMVIGPKVLLGNDEKRQRMEIADEQLETIGKTFLGQTLGCARCHDHKFDPVPTADYYAMAGILTSAQVMERRYMLGEQRVMERLVGLGAQGDQLDEEYEKYWRERPKVKARADKARAALEALKKSDQPAVDEIAKSNVDAVAQGANDASTEMQKRIDAQTALVAQLDGVLAKPPSIPPRAMIPTDADKPADENIRVSGQFDRLGKVVPRGYLSVVSSESNFYQIPPQESGRIQLAEWLTDEHYGAGRLVARVMANRIWHHLMGRGIVRTVDNFGRTGETPSHPELLDYLATRLIESGWSIKLLVREIVLSDTFALSSHHDQGNFSTDPDNRRWWRAERRRLEPEALRDTILAVAGQLDLTPMNSSVAYLGDQATGVGNNVRRKTDFPARSIYLPVIRNDLPELFDVFDFANPHTTTGARPQTMVAPQGLFMLNDTMVMNAAEATAKRFMVQPDTVDAMFEIVLGQTPSDAQRSAVVDFVKGTIQKLSDQKVAEAERPLRAWSMACQAVFASSQFQFLE
jgi:Protein of unknown function (DUF1553)/Protein of unknown function (DUF1549)/Planctomycete cytochrome C